MCRLRFVVRLMPLFVVNVFLTVSIQVQAASAPLGGFLPFVGFGLTNEFKNANHGDSMFFGADPSLAPGGSLLGGTHSPYFDIALFDSGAATHILTPLADGPLGFDIDGNGFDGKHIQNIGGATGIVPLEINNPLGVYVAGMADRTSTESTLVMDSSRMRGQTTFATLSAPGQWKLPNIIGLPMAAQHAIKISNDQPLIFELGGRTVRTPQVDLVDLGSGANQGIQRRVPIELKPGLGFVSGPIYVLNTDVDDIIEGVPLHENPQSPTLIENGALFVDVDLNNRSETLNDMGMLFDTGADMTVISELTAVRLGFDPVLDLPDFVIQVEGSGGVSDGIPGFFVDRLGFDTIGGKFVQHDVPVAVLDVTNPADPGNILPGIIGMQLFNGRNLVIDANPSIGQGGIGPSVFIGDKVTSDSNWTSNLTSGQWTTADNWSSPGVPNELSVSRIGNVSGTDQKAIVNSDTTVFRTEVLGTDQAEMSVDIQESATLTVFADVIIQTDGRVHLEGGQLDAQLIQVDGGTLSGTGAIYVGSGPIHGNVRNRTGAIQPGHDNGHPVGTIAIDGDFAQETSGNLQIDLGGTTAGTQHDQLSVSRFAFLSGQLEVSLVDLGQGLFSPVIGDTFEILNTEEGISGTFESVALPTNFNWEIDYDSNRVLLEVTGLNLTSNSRWNIASGGHWDSIDNWEPREVPNGNDTSVVFGNGITQSSTVTSDVDVAVNTILFENTHRYTIAGTGSLSLAGSSSQPAGSISVMTGNHEFQLDVNLMTDTTIDIANNSVLEFAAQLNLAGNTLTQTGPGTLVVNHTLNAGGGSLLVQNGWLSGRGTLAGDLQNLGGTLSPGTIPLTTNAAVPEPTTFGLLWNGLLVIYLFCIFSGNQRRLFLFHKSCDLLIDEL